MILAGVVNTGPGTQPRQVPAADLGPRQSDRGGRGSEVDGLMWRHRSRDSSIWRANTMPVLARHVAAHTYDAAH